MTKTVAQTLEELRPTLFGPAGFMVPKCKDRIQMNGDQTVKCFGERFHTITTRGVHAGFYKEGDGKYDIIRWKTEYV